MSVSQFPQPVPNSPKASFGSPRGVVVPRLTIPKPSDGYTKIVDESDPYSHCYVDTVARAAALRSSKVVFGTGGEKRPVSEYIEKYPGYVSERTKQSENSSIKHNAIFGFDKEAYVKPSEHHREFVTPPPDRSMVTRRDRQNMKLQNISHNFRFSHRNDTKAAPHSHESYAGAQLTDDQKPKPMTKEQTTGHCYKLGFRPVDDQYISHAKESFQKQSLDGYDPTIAAKQKEAVLKTNVVLGMTPNIMKSSKPVYKNDYKNHGQLDYVERRMKNREEKAKHTGSSLYFGSDNTGGVVSEFKEHFQRNAAPEKVDTKAFKLLNQKVSIALSCGAPQTNYKAEAMDAFSWPESARDSSAADSKKRNQQSNVDIGSRGKQQGVSEHHAHFVDPKSMKSPRPSTFTPRKAQDANDMTTSAMGKQIKADLLSSHFMLGKEKKFGSYGTENKEHFTDKSKDRRPAKSNAKAIMSSKNVNFGSDEVPDQYISNSRENFKREGFVTPDLPGEPMKLLDSETRPRTAVPKLPLGKVDNNRKSNILLSCRKTGREHYATTMMTDFPKRPLTAREEVKPYRMFANEPFNKADHLRSKHKMGSDENAFKGQSTTHREYVHPRAMVRPQYQIGVWAARNRVVRTIHLPY